MAQIKFRVEQMQGLTPAVDPVESETIFALNGENYLFDSKGPKSAFGNRALTPQPQANPSYTQGVRLHLDDGDRCFQMDSDGIWEWDEPLGGYRPIFMTGNLAPTPGVWTWAYLAGLVYLCHPAAGLLVFDPSNDTCVPHSLVGIGSPEEPLAVSENNGRLGVIDKEWIYWSAPSDGLDFEPKLGGAGFQLLSDRVSGYPLIITSYPGGFLTWMTGGVLRSEFTGDAAVFRHRSLTTAIRPVNPFCTCRVEDDVTVVLDERGLYKTQGGTPEPYAPVFNEFLLQYIRENKMVVNNNLQLEYDELQKTLYVFASTTYGGTMYQRTFVYYPTLDRWGEFSELHSGIIPIKIGPGPREGNYFGFVDFSGVTRYWVPTESREVYPIYQGANALNLFLATVQKVTQFTPEADGISVAATGRFQGFDATGIARRSAYYAPGVVVPEVPRVTGLGSRLQFGLFRPNNQGPSDFMGDCINVMIRSWEQNVANDTLETIEDYMLEADDIYDEDWNALSGLEDWNEDSSGLSDNSIGYGLTVIGTLDGVNSYVQEDPQLVEIQRGTRYYSCCVPGVWHKLEIRASDVGESYHVKSGEITVTSSGRLL